MTKANQKQFSCLQCSFTSDSIHGVKVHKGRMHKNLPCPETVYTLDRFTEKVQDNSICKKNKKRNDSGDYEDFPVSKRIKILMVKMSF